MNVNNIGSRNLAMVFHRTTIQIHSTNSKTGFNVQCVRKSIKTAKWENGRKRRGENTTSMIDFGQLWLRIIQKPGQEPIETSVNRCLFQNASYFSKFCLHTGFSHFRTFKIRFVYFYPAAAPKLDAKRKKKKKTIMVYFYTPPSVPISIVCRPAAHSIRQQNGFPF